jgi:argininosuccinate lyase
MAIESRLTEKIGPAGAKLHTGRSRNDQVATDLRLYVKGAGKQLGAAMDLLLQTLVARAQEMIDVAMPGYTHTQRAQPVLLSHHLLAYVEMLRRDRGRLEEALDRADVSPLGSGALAGSGFAVDRDSLAKDLGFKQASANSLDAVGDRDFVIELLAVLSILMIHLSRLNGEIVLWTSAEFNFAELPDALASGSSMMPNKKNPCAAELVRAKSARVSGHLVAMLMVMKGLPLAYNRDLQEDKEPLFDSVDTALASVQVTARLIEHLKFKPEILEAAATGGYTLATEAADHLVRKGLPFREAHRVIGQVVSYAIQQGKPLEKLSLEELRRFAPAFDSDIWQSLSLEGALNSRDVFGGTAPARVKEALANAKA